jgi:WD40 repeat protein
MASENELRIWDHATRELVRQIRTNEAAGLAFGGGDRILAATDSRGGVRYWDTRSWETLCSASASGSDEVSFSRDGRWIAVGGGERTITVWKAPPCH